VPLARLFSLSLSSEAGPFAAYAELLSSTVFREVFRNTLMLAAIVTAICVVLA
jgi:putative spermidine/putrescine transport system permease protein